MVRIPSLHRHSIPYWFLPFRFIDSRIAASHSAFEPLCDTFALQSAYLHPRVCFFHPQRPRVSFLLLFHPPSNVHLSMPFSHRPHNSKFGTPVAAHPIDQGRRGEASLDGESIPLVADGFAVTRYVKLASQVEAGLPCWRMG